MPWIMALTTDHHNCRSIRFHKLRTIHGYGSEQTSLANFSWKQATAVMTRVGSIPTVRLSYRACRVSLSVSLNRQRHAHGDSAVRNVIVHIVHACQPVANLQNYWLGFLASIAIHFNSHCILIFSHRNHNQSYAMERVQSPLLCKQLVWFSFNILIVIVPFLCVACLVGSQLNSKLSVKRTFLLFCSRC